MKLPAASHGVSQQRIEPKLTLQAAGYLPEERINQDQEEGIFTLGPLTP